MHISFVNPLAYTLYHGLMSKCDLIIHETSPLNSDATVSCRGVAWRAVLGGPPKFKEFLEDFTQVRLPRRGGEAP